MLELRTYSRDELAEALKIKNDNQRIKKKLETMAVEYKVNGRGANCSFELTCLRHEFKVYCMMELGFSGQYNYDKLKRFTYYFLSDEEFRKQTPAQMGRALDCSPACRQTIKKWKDMYMELNLFIEDDRDCYYFSTLGDMRKEITREQYLKAWDIYWKTKYEFDWEYASQRVIDYIGGFPRKSKKVLFNAFYGKIIDNLVSYALKSIESEVANASIAENNFENNTEEAAR